MYHDPGKDNTESAMEIVFHGSGNTKTSGTEVNLDFKGWRAVWIGYAEFFEGKGTPSRTPKADCLIDPKEEGVGLDEINQVEFRITSAKQDKLYIDLVRFAVKMSKQTRDMVVKQVSSTQRTRSTDKHSSFYDEKDFWQMSLRWHEDSRTSCTDTKVIPTQAEKEEVVEIEKRLEQWYASDDQIADWFDVELNELGNEPSEEKSFKDFQYKRWKGLEKNIDDAVELLPKVLENKPSLFALLSDQGKEERISGPIAKTKFNNIFFKVLLPLAIDYNFKSRKNSEGSSEDSDSGACEDIDDDLKNIVELLLHIEDQGWAAGSGIGTLAHEMNKSGAGFIHSMFLLRKALRKCPELLGRLLNAMKWYTDFKEIYQENGDYIYDGTTADRMRTILFYRLMIILMQTDQNDQVRDLKCFRNWVNHILKVNKGLGGFVKPDYTGYHHKTFYGSAYVPQAIHNAAVVQYLLDGTSFALDSVAKQNLRNVLAVLRTVAVKYSTPNALCGRFPQYDKAILAELLPAYAYISYVHGKGKASKPTVKDPEMFLRLAKSLQDPDLKPYLEKGELTSAIHYWHTIGSLDILDQVKEASASKTPEDSPNGHWSKNYAALSVHRRADWSVAAKGFNRYTWDFEHADTQNVYGVFVSHGSLQISNSEAALKSYDVENGWDWTRVPGTTTVNLDLDNIRTDKARYYNPGGFAGGVAMIGSDDVNLGPQNGAFGMKFEKPDYDMKTNKASPLKKMKFEFKKSYFFYDHLIVAVGSDILLECLDDSDDFYAQTTLFQDKLLDPSKSSTINIGDAKHDLRMLLKDWKSSKSRSLSAVLLTDTHGNKYKVKTDRNTVVNVKISDQESRKSDGSLAKSKARYATAWIMHKQRDKRDKQGKKGRKCKKGKQVNQGNLDDDQEKEKNEYEYAVLVKGGEEDLLSKYQVKRIDNKAHAVHIQTTANSNDGVFAYSIFDRTINNDFGPVKTTDSPCMIMAKKENGFLYLAISNPSLEFEKITPTKDSRLETTCSGTNRKDLESDGCVPDVFSPLNSDDVRSKMMFCMKGKEKDITVTLNCEFEQDGIVSVKVDGKDKTKHSRQYARKKGNRKVKFLKLVDGFTTEIKIRYRRCAYVTS